MYLTDVQHIILLAYYNTYREPYKPIAVYLTDVQHIIRTAGLLQYIPAEPNTEYYTAGCTHHTIGQQQYVPAEPNTYDGRMHPNVPVEPTVPPSTVTETRHHTPVHTTARKDYYPSCTQ